MVVDAKNLMECLGNPVFFFSFGSFPFRIQKKMNNHRLDDGNDKGSDKFFLTRTELLDLQNPRDSSKKYPYSQSDKMNDIDSIMLKI